MTETQGTQDHGLSERGALAYLYWPTAAATLMTIGCLEHVASTIARFFGLA